MSYYVHNVPGRLRVRTPIVKGDPETAEDIRKLLEAVVGVDSTAVRTLTGSVIINYNSKAIDSDTILDILMRRGYFDASKVQTRSDYVETAATKAGSIIGKALFGLFLEKAFEGSALSLLSVLI